MAGYAYNGFCYDVGVTGLDSLAVRNAIEGAMFWPEGGRLVHDVTSVALHADYYDMNVWVEGGAVSIPVRAYSCAQHGPLPGVYNPGFMSYELLLVLGCFIAFTAGLSKGGQR